MGIALVAIAHELIDDVLQRVRDPQGTVASRTFVLEMLSKAQQLINAKLSLVLDSSSLVTEPLRCFYPIRDLLPASQKVLFVQDAHKDLLYVPWRSFWHMKRGWPRVTADAMQLWSTVGRDLLVVWPSTLAPETLTVVSAAITDPVQGEQSTMELADNIMPLVLDLAEVLTLLKMRKADLSPEAMSSLQGRVSNLE